MSEQYCERFRPTLVTLEERVVPAWWAVTAPTPAGGTLGDTGATHAGELTFRSDYTPDAAGKVTVWADSPTSAVVAALAGTITVTLGDEEPTDTVFGADTVGVATNHKAFAVSASGNSVSLSFEDMAGMDGADYDYNDRSWAGVTVAPAYDPVAHTGTWTWANQNIGESARVDLAVTAASPERFRWRYTVTNLGFSTTCPAHRGLGKFVVTVPNPVGLADVASSQPDWTATVGTSPSNVVWRTPDNDYGSVIARGASGWFEFTTPPAPPAPANGLVVLAAKWLMPEESGLLPIYPDANGPAQGPGSVQVVITYADSTEVSDKDGLRVAKLENAFISKQPSTDTVEYVKDPVAAAKN